MKKTLKMTFMTATIATAVMMTGCASVDTAIEKRNLDVSSKMSDTIFLNPVSPNDKTVFIQFRNTSDKNIDSSLMQSRLEKALEARGYTISSDPNKANFLVQENILSIGKVKKENAYGAIQAGYGGAIAGGVAGIALGSSGSYGHSAAVGSLIGAGIGMAAHALIKDVYFNCVTDLQIKQRAAKGQVVNTVQTTNSQSGSSANTQQTISGTSNWISYRTRIVSVANKVNLDFKEAEPTLEKQLIKTSAGIF